jgi:hypothetical protein
VIHGPSERGFALIEVLIAVLLLAIASIGIVMLLAISGTAIRASKIASWATVLAGEKLEQLRALRWAYDETGVPVSDLSTDLSVSPPTGVGRGLAASPADALIQSAPGYVDYLDGSGRWTGNGMTPGPNAVFIRRWSIQPAVQDPANSLVFRVLVIPVVDRVQSGASAAAAGALVTGTRTRTAS